MKEYKNLTRIQKKKKMPSGGPEFYADMKYKNAIVEHERRKQRLKYYKNQLKSLERSNKQQNYQRFLLEKIQRVKKML